MKENKEIVDIKKEIFENIDNIFVELFDDDFEVKYKDLGVRKISISISRNDKFKLSEIQSKVFMFSEYFKGKYIYIKYELSVNKIQKVIFNHFPLFFYNDFKKVKIIVTI